MKPTENPAYIHQMAPSADLDENPIATLKQGVAYEVNDMVKLELTAEQMLQDEAGLVFDYVANDAKHFWTDLKEGMLDLEAATGQLLLSVADPTSIEWQQNQWLAHDEYVQHTLE